MLAAKISETSNVVFMIMNYLFRVASYDYLKIKTTFKTIYYYENKCFTTN